MAALQWSCSTSHLSLIVSAIPFLPLSLQSVLRSNFLLASTPPPTRTLTLTLTRNPPLLASTPSLQPLSPAAIFVSLQYGPSSATWARCRFCYGFIYHSCLDPNNAPMDPSSDEASIPMIVNTPPMIAHSCVKKWYVDS